MECIDGSLHVIVEVCVCTGRNDGLRLDVATLVYYGEHGVCSAHVQAYHIGFFEFVFHDITFNVVLLAKILLFWNVDLATTAFFYAAIYNKV